MKYVLASLLCIPTMTYPVSAGPVKSPMTVHDQEQKAEEFLRLVRLCDQDDDQLSNEDRQKLEYLVEEFNPEMIELTSGLSVGHVKKARRIAIKKYYKGDDCDRCARIAKNMYFLEQASKQESPMRSRGKRLGRHTNNEAPITFVFVVEKDNK